MLVSGCTAKGMEPKKKNRRREGALVAPNSFVAPKLWGLSPACCKTQEVPFRAGEAPRVLPKPCARHLITEPSFKKSQGEEVKTHIHKTVDSIKSFWWVFIPDNKPSKMSGCV